MNATLEIPSCKVVLFGDSGVGKTSVVQYFDHSCFDPIIDTTVGAAFVRHEMCTKSGRISMHVWDTAGQERYRSLLPTYARGAVGALVVFDLSNPLTYANVQSWIDQFPNFGCEDCMIYIVANKSDLLATVDIPAAEKWATGRGYRFFAVSAKTGNGIAEMFQAIAEAIAERKPGGTARFEVTANMPEDAPPKQSKTCC
jgi:small GTP-binding protein